MKLSYEPEHASGGYRLTNANLEWYEWAKKNLMPENPDKNFEIVYVGFREYDDGYEQVCVCIRLTNPNVKEERNIKLPADKLTTTQLLFIKLYKTEWDE